MDVLQYVQYTYISTEAIHSLTYQNLVGQRGLLHSDQELFNGGAADALVQQYIGSQSAFFKDFVEGMIKMGDITPLTGSNGQIRMNCRRIN